MTNLVIKSGNPYPLGALVGNRGVNFSMVSQKASCGVILYHKKTNEEIRLPFEDKHRVGNVFCFFVEGIRTREYEYNFYEDETSFVDPYAKLVCGNEKWGNGCTQELSLRGEFYRSGYDWANEQKPQLSFSESILYSLHVRGFTKHSSSGVRHKGTFLGIQEKIPYFLELGVTTLELMPCYEFEEFEANENRLSMEYQVSHYTEDIRNTSPEKKCNFWGFKKGFYMAPKKSYCAGSDAALEFKNLVHALHEANLEIVMQFYFTQDCSQGYILEVLKHWVLEYHVDGFHLMGRGIPVTLLSTDPILARTKLFYHDFPLEEIYGGANNTGYKNLCFYRPEFMQDIRRFLKGDSDMLKGFLFHLKNFNESCGVVNYITNYDGFSLMDLVSYERKHNEQNQESNQDGTDYNYSWNCGVEGPTRKKGVLKLRQKQIKNALLFLLTAQGTPMLLSGDEFGHTKLGNNNSYCQDNEINWINWKLAKKNQELFSFVKEAIAFRKQHGILHVEHPLSFMDRYGSGFPEISFHGLEAWKGETDNYLHHIAVMLSDRPVRKGAQDTIYLAYNMHWEEKKFEVPSLPKGENWRITFWTDAGAVIEAKENGHACLLVPPRSIVILSAVDAKRG